jgi:hypothetical protein
MGEPGEPGDADRILHFGQRMTSAYAGLIAWAARVRGASRSELFDRAFELLAQFADGPIEQYRAWVNEIVDTTDRKLAEIADGREPTGTVTITLTLEIGDGGVEAFSEELERVGSSLAAYGG